jgi:hypothetical protein
MGMNGTRASKKWIEGIEASTPLVEAAELVLDNRLSAVERLVPLARKKAHEDDEHVHDLRVAARRAAAAVRIFAPCFGGGVAKTRRSLKRLRRAASNARECDVQRRILEADVAAGRRGRGVGGPIYLYRVRARRRAGHEPRVRPEALPDRSEADGGVQF